MDWIKCITNRLLRAARREAGITLIETLFAITIFGIVSTALVGVLTSATAADGRSRQKTIALELAQQQVEYIRQLDYANVCAASGNPSCSAGVAGIPTTQEKNIKGLWYELTTTIKYVDDRVPTSYRTYADYKQVRVTVSRARDDTVLARVITNVSSSSRVEQSSVDDGVINVAALDGVVNTPLENTTITLRRSTGWSANDVTVLTGSDASTTFAGLTPSADSGDDYYYDVYAAYPGYETFREYTPEYATGLPPEVHLVAGTNPSTTIELYKPCGINVNVTDQSTGLPYIGTANVTISSLARNVTQTFTITNGHLSLTPGTTLNVTASVGGGSEKIVPSDDYAVTVTTPGGRTSDALEKSVPDSSVDYVNGNLSTTFDVTLKTVVVPTTATVTINVRKISNNWNPVSCTNSTTNIANATVKLSDSAISYSQTKITGSNGQVVFTGVPLAAAGTYHYNVDASRAGYYDPPTGWNRVWYPTLSGSLPNQAITGDVTLCAGVS